MGQTKQRGSAWSIKLALWIHKRFGYTPFFIMLYPIAFIYYIKATNVRRALKLYYKQIGLSFTQRAYFEHLRKFAIVMTDRFISKIDPASYTLRLDKQKAINEVKDGAIVLFSHFGGWSVTMDFLKDTDLHVNIVMLEVLKEGIKEIEKSLTSQGQPNNIHIIDLSENTRLDAYIDIARAISNKEVVSMMGDRANNEKHAIVLPFFGKDAKFNKTPFELAKRANFPVIAYFILYTRSREYELRHFVINSNQSLEEMVKEYIGLYEKIVREAPDQWFNLYDFWEERCP